MDYTTRHETPLSTVLIASDGASLVGLWFEGQRHFATTLRDAVEEKDDLPFFDEVRRWLDQYFAGTEPDFMPKTEPRGTDFQKRVWRRLSDIPYGHTVTYGQIARELGCRSAQAVGSAVGRNPVSLIIPCHRVVGSNGTLGGYAAGEDRKQRLIDMERACSIA